MSTDASTPAMPASAPEPGLELALQLASVRRSLEWALVDPSRLAAAPFLGAGCATRVSRLLGVVEPENQGSLEALTSLLASIDETDEPTTRLALATDAAGQLARMVPSDLSGLLLPLAEAQGRFIDPRRRRRGDRKKKEAAEPTPPADGSAEQAGATSEAASEGVETVATPEAVPEIIAAALAEARAEQDAGDRSSGKAERTTPSGACCSDIQTAPGQTSMRSVKTLRSSRPSKRWA